MHLCNNFKTWSSSRVTAKTKLHIQILFRSGHHNYVFNLSSPTVKEEWKADAMNAKLALGKPNGLIGQ